MTEDLVYIKHNEVVCDSLQVAEKFHKSHRNVTRSISDLLKNEQIKSRKMFWLAQFKDEKGRTYNKYYMNRDGFSILVMGFNGKDALHWKLEYIDAFNKMESIVQEKNTQQWVEARKTGKITRKVETDVLQRLVELAKSQGSEHSDKLYMTYSKLANKIAGITNGRDNATFQQLCDLSTVENIILHVVDDGILRNEYYKQIYIDCKLRLEQFSRIAYLQNVN